MKVAVSRSPSSYGWDTSPALRGECLERGLTELEIDGLDWAIHETLALRSDPRVIAAVEACTKEERLGIEILEIPDGVQFYIEVGDSNAEWIVENHREWPGWENGRTA